MLKSMTFRSTLAAVACALSLSAHAMADSKKVEIAAGDLRPALLELSRAYGVELLYQPSQLDHFRTAGVKGDYTPEAAVKLLLKGTPLELRTDPSGAMMVINPNAPQATAISALTEQSSPAPGSGDGSQQSRSLQLAQSAPGTTAGAATPLVVTRENNGRAELLQEVVVTAQKRSELLQDVPISISVLGGKELEQSTFSGVTDALNTVPGVAALANQAQQSGTVLAVRGVSAGSAEGSGASTVAYYVDGVPFGLVRSALVPDPNIYDLSRIEVLRGPQGTLYGANALNGVVRVLTNDPDLDNFDLKIRGNLSTTEGGGGNYSGDAAANLPIVKGKLAARLVVGDEHQSGWLDGTLGTNLNDADFKNVRLKLALQPTDELRIDLSGWHSQSSFAGPAQSDVNNQVTAVIPQPMNSHFNASGLSIAYQFSFFSLTSVSSYVDYVSDNTSDLGVFGLNNNDVTNITSRVFSEELNLTSKLDGPWSWSAGVFYRDDKDTYYQAQTPYSPPGPEFIFAHLYDTSRSAAIYGELSRRFWGDQLQLTLGARYFHDNAATAPIDVSDVPSNEVRATSSATTPRVVLTWFPSKAATGYASFSQGFRSGLPQTYLVGEVVPDFPAAKPDKLTNYEVGVKGTLWDQRVSYDAAIFYMDWQHIQQQLLVQVTSGPSAGSQVGVQLNGNSASGAGAEFSFAVRPLDSLTLGANFGWNNLHFDSTVYSGGAILFPEGSRPDISPEYTAGASAQYTFPLGGDIRGVLSASGNYTSPLFTTYLNAGTRESNSLLITRGTFDIQFPQHWTAGLFVDNANNWNGIQQFGYGSPFWAARQRPRTYGVRFNYSFQ